MSKKKQEQRFLIYAPAGIVTFYVLFNGADNIIFGDDVVLIVP